MGISPFKIWWPRTKRIACSSINDKGCWRIYRNLSSFGHSFRISLWNFDMALMQNFRFGIDKIDWTWGELNEVSTELLWVANSWSCIRFLMWLQLNPQNLKPVGKREGRMQNLTKYSKSAASKNPIHILFNFLKWVKFALSKMWYYDFKVQIGTWSKIWWNFWNCWLRSAYF